MQGKENKEKKIFANIYKHINGMFDIEQEYTKNHMS